MTGDIGFAGLQLSGTLPPFESRGCFDGSGTGQACRHTAYASLVWHRAHWFTQRLGRSPSGFGSQRCFPSKAVLLRVHLPCCSSNRGCRRWQREAISQLAWTHQYMRVSMDHNAGGGSEAVVVDLSPEWLARALVAHVLLSPFPFRAYVTNESH